VGDAIQFVFPRNLDEPLLAGDGRVDVRRDDLRAVRAGGRQQFAATVEDAALADEAEAALLADAVAGGVKDVIFQGAAGGQMADRGGGPFRPVGRQHHEIGAEQRQDAGRLGETAVVTNVHSDAEAAEVVDGERPVARRGETVHSEIRQVDFTIGGDEAVGADEGAGVEQVGTGAFEHPDDGPDAEFAAVGGEGVGGRAGRRLRERPRLVAAGKAIAGQHALGEDGQPGAASGRVAQPLSHRLEVVRHVAEAAVDLYGRDLPGLH